MVRIRINKPKSLRSWCLKGTDEFTAGKDPTVPLMLSYSQPLCISMHAKGSTVSLMLNYSQPLYISVHAKERANAKHAGMGMGR